MTRGSVPMALAALASPVLLAAVVCVLLVGMIASPGSSIVGQPAWLAPNAPELFVRTLVVSLVIGILATLLAIPWAWIIGRGCRRSVALLAALPLLLPSYLVYGAWSLVRAPGTLLGDALVGAPDWVWSLTNTAHASLSLAMWSWPIACLVLAIGVRRIGGETLDALALSGASRSACWRVIARQLRGSIVASVALVALVMTGSAVPLHVAQVETYSITLWRAVAEGRGGGAMLVDAAPLLVVAFVGAWFAVPRFAESQISHGRRARSRTAIAGSIAVLALAVGVPAALFLRQGVSNGTLGGFFSIAGGSIAHSATLGLVLGATVAVIGLSASLSAGGRGAGVLWVVIALVPGVLVGASVARASVSVRALDALGTTDAGVLVAHLARFGAIGWLVGRVFASSETRDLRDARALFTNGTLTQWARTRGPSLLACLAGIIAVTALLSLHEIESTVIAAPAGVQPFARLMLDWLHYMRDDALTGGAIVLLGIGIGVTGFIAILSRLDAKRVSCVLALTALASGFGCEDRGVDERGRILGASVLGTVGHGDGQYIYPRAIDAADGAVWVIDKTARVQELSTDGEIKRWWTMPSSDRGKPCGITHGRDGRLYVADTHEHRVSIFDLASDDPLATMTTFGTYGEGPGEFIYPTDVALSYDERGDVSRIYVSEYGGNDRISVFDARATFLFAFGSQGTPEEDGVRFRRPQSIEVDDERGELIVTDAGNHRVGRFTLEGEQLQWFGRSDGLAGRAPGEFSYPYGLARLPDGTLLVSEYGNSRLQRLDPETGACVGLYGVPGREPGEVTAPWGVAFERGDVYVLDSANNRLQRFPLPGRVTLE